MRNVLIGCAVLVVAACVLVSVAAAAELTVADVRNVKGDGPDGKGNTGDDTWGFWFQLVKSQGYRRLDLATELLTPAQRANGIAGKVQGPIGASVPNPKDTEGWIYHSDWDGRYEGIWGDSKAKQVLGHPYNEKADGAAVAVTYKVPADGVYTISGKLTDLSVVKVKHWTISGVKAVVDVLNVTNPAQTDAPAKHVGATEPIGDMAGPESREFKFENVELKKDQLVRLAIDPNGGWGTDLTRIDLFKIEPVKTASTDRGSGTTVAVVLLALGAGALMLRRIF